MSETTISNPEDKISININNSDGGATSGGSFLDRILDLGLKLIIPIGLIFALIAIVVLFRVVLPIIDVLGDLDLPLSFLLPAPIGGIIGLGGALFGFLSGD